MLIIDNVAWAKVRINGHDYIQALIIGDKIIPRKVEKIKAEFGTDHLISPKEQKLIFSRQPEAIVIADGWSGVLAVDTVFIKKAKKKHIKTHILHTPEAVEKYNQLVGQGIRVNALIHTTC